MRGCLLVITVAALLPTLSHGYRHVGAQNPVAEIWSITSGDSGVTGQPVVGDPDFPAVHAWQINSNDSGRLRYQIDGPDADEAWTLSARLRVVAPDTPVDIGKLIEINNGVSRFLITFGSADGATLVNVGSTAPAPDIAVAPSQPGRTDYVHLSVAYDPDLGVATIQVNGELVTAEAAGVAAGSVAARVNFGDGGNDGYEIANGLDPTDGSDCPSWICGSSGGWRLQLYREANQ